MINLHERSVIFLRLWKISTKLLCFSLQKRIINEDESKMVLILLKLFLKCINHKSLYQFLATAIWSIFLKGWIRWTFKSFAGSMTKIKCLRISETFYGLNDMKNDLYLKSFLRFFIFSLIIINIQRRQNRIEENMKNHLHLLNF